MDAWWKLPSSQLFLETAADLLAERGCVIVTACLGTPPGLDAALANLLSDSRDYRVVRLHISPTTVLNPTEWLYEQLVHDLPPEQPRDLASLGRESTLTGHVILLTCTDIGLAKPWIATLGAAQVIFKSLSRWERPNLVLSIPPLPTTLSSAREQDVAVQTYQPTAQLHEMRYLISSFIPTNTKGELMQELRLECMVQLSMWDIGVATDLSRLSLADLLDPYSHLRDWAVSQGWGNLDLSSSTAYEGEKQRLGITGLWGGQIAWHSAWLALQDTPRELERRLWKAQVSVLFPFIEERRLKWVEHTRNLLRVPFETNFGVIEDAADLEIGPLVHQLRQKRHLLGESVIRELEWLRLARHKLAHLEVLDAKFLDRPGSPLAHL